TTTSPIPGRNDRADARTSPRRPTTTVATPRPTTARDGRRGTATTATAAATGTTAAASPRPRPKMSSPSDTPQPVHRRAPASVNQGRNADTIASTAPRTAPAVARCAD